MDIAKKLREVVTANFIEIVRSEEEQRQQKKGSTVTAADPPRPITAQEAAPASPYSPLRAENPGIAAAEAELKARRELDELEALLDSVQDEEDISSIEAEFIESPEDKTVEVSEADEDVVSLSDKTVDLTPDVKAEVEAEEEEHTPPIEAVVAADEEPILVAADDPEAVTPDDEKTVNLVTPIALTDAKMVADVAIPEPIAAETPVVAEATPTVEPETAKIEVTAKQEAEPPSSTATGATYDPLSYLNPDSTVDFARLLRDAKLPTVVFGAEQARKLIAALPEDLPMRVKRMTVKATLDAVSPNAEIDTQEIVADAMLKRMHVAQYRDILGESIQTTLRARQMEIDRLEAEADRLKAEVAVEQQRLRSGDTLCNQQITHLEQVILFFQTDEALIQDSASRSPEGDEVPPFMRDDSVYRLLGMNSGEPESAVEENGETPRRTRRR